MKLLLFTDLHGDIKSVRKLISKARKEKPDYLVCSGDLIEWGGLEEFDGVLKKFEVLKIPMLFVPGNHEEWMGVKFKGKYLVNLHKKFLDVGDYLFFGYGGGGFSMEDVKFEKFVKKNKGKFKGRKIVFLAHGPFYGTKLDKLFPRDKHRGNKSYTKFIRKYKPVLSVCGHFHETFGKKDKIGKNVVVNPGPEGKVHKLS
tara:strand:+ start:199 stop:798 length:600 start_codon:yes stop_codon:yes gene_type:complete